MKNHTFQCDSCAFKITESQASLEDDRAVEKKYQVLRSLENSPKRPRAIFVSFGIEKTDDTDKTETCFIDSPLWPSKVKKVQCPDRIDDCLSLEDALNFRHSSAANKLAKEANSTASRALTVAKREARIAMIAAIIATVTLIITNIEQIISIIGTWLIKR